MPNMGRVTANPYFIFTATLHRDWKVGCMMMPRKNWVFVLLGSIAPVLDYPIQPGRKLLDWPADVLELAGALGFDKFSVVGDSGGGVSCWFAPIRFLIALIQQRLFPAPVRSMRGMLLRGGACQCVSKLSSAGMLLSGKYPGYERHVLDYDKKHRKLLYKLAQQLHGADKEIFSREAVRGVLPTQYGRVLSRSRDLADFVLSMKPWGFSVKDIRMKVNMAR